MANQPSLNFRSHQVSQVILRQFTNGRQLKVFGKTGFIRYDIPKNVGFAYLNRQMYAQTEKKWGRVEGDFGQLLSSGILQSGKLLGSQAHINIIKKLISLHFVRSRAAQVLFDQSEKRQFDELIEDLNKKGADKAVIRAKWENDMERLRLSLVNDLIKKINAHIDMHNLEIVEAPNSNSFILGDNPVVNLTFDGKIGIMQGVGFASSDAVFLPLTPKFVASLTQENHPTHYYLTSAKSVHKLNKMTRKQSVSEYYVKPTS